MTYCLEEYRFTSFTPWLNPSHSSFLVRSSRFHNFDNTHLTLTTMFSTVMDPEGATLSKAFDNCAWRRALKQDFKGSLWMEPMAFKPFWLPQNDDGPPCTRNCVGVWKQYRWDSRFSTTAKAIELPNVSNTPSATVLCQTSFILSLTCWKQAQLCTCVRNGESTQFVRRSNHSPHWWK